MDIEQAADKRQADYAAVGVAAEHEVDRQAGKACERIIAVIEPEDEIVRILPAQPCGKLRRRLHIGAAVFILRTADDDARGAAV